MQEIIKNYIKWKWFLVLLLFLSLCFWWRNTKNFMLNIYVGNEWKEWKAHFLKRLLNWLWKLYWTYSFFFLALSLLFFWELFFSESKSHKVLKCRSFGEYTRPCAESWSSRRRKNAMCGRHTWRDSEAGDSDKSWQCYSPRSTVLGFC